MNIINALKAIKNAVQQDYIIVADDNITYWVNKRIGICHHVNALCTEDHKLLQDVFVELGKHYSFPVENALFKFKDESLLYAEYLKESDKYDTSTKYGKIRMQLLDDLIEYFESHESTSSTIQ